MSQSCFVDVVTNYRLHLFYFLVELRCGVVILLSFFAFTFAAAAAAAGAASIACFGKPVGHSNRARQNMVLRCASMGVLKTC